MSKTTVSESPGKKELRQFGFIFAAGLVLFFGLIIPWLAEYPWPRWPWIAAGVFVVLALVYPLALRPLNWLWLKIGHALGWINTRIILGLVFFVIVFPTGLLMRIMRKDPMARKQDASMSSYRVQSQQSPREQLERPF